MDIRLKNINAYTIFALIVFIAGFLFYISWGLRYGVWADIGIYSITIVLVFGGVVGTILSLSIKKAEENEE